MPYIDRWMKRPMKTTTKCSYHQMTAIFAFVSGILFCLPTIASLISTKHITCQLYLPHQPQVIRIEPYNTWIMNADRYNQNPLIKKNVVTLIMLTTWQLHSWSSALLLYCYSFADVWSSHWNKCTRIFSSSFICCTFVV